jgi:hypothetical protein
MPVRIDLLTPDEHVTFIALREHAGALGTRFRVFDDLGSSALRPEQESGPCPVPLRRWSHGFEVRWPADDATVRVSVMTTGNAWVSAASPGPDGTIVPHEPVLALPPSLTAVLDFAHANGEPPSEHAIAAAGGILDSLGLRAVDRRRGREHPGSGADGIRAGAHALDRQESQRTLGRPPRQDSARGPPLLDGRAGSVWQGFGAAAGSTRAPAGAADGTTGPAPEIPGARSPLGVRVAAAPAGVTARSEHGKAVRWGCGAAFVLPHRFRASPTPSPRPSPAW